MGFKYNRSEGCRHFAVIGAVGRSEPTVSYSAVPCRLSIVQGHCQQDYL